MKPLLFNLNTESTPVMLSGQEYQLKEMSAADRDRYMDSLSKRMKYDQGGQPVGIGSFTGLQTDLLHLCLFKDGNTVPTTEINQWPASVVSQLFKAAQLLNHLTQDEDALEVTKNG